MVLFPSPFYFVFDISNLFRTYKIISSYELTRPVMGTIFLVYIYMCMCLSWSKKCRRSYVVKTRACSVSFGRLKPTSDYHLFDKAIVLDQVMRQAGVDTEQQLFRDLFLRLRDGQTTVEDWKHLMKQTPAVVGATTPFTEALHLFATASM